MPSFRHFVGVRFDAAMFGLLRILIRMSWYYTPQNWMLTSYPVFDLLTVPRSESYRLRV